MWYFEKQIWVMWNRSSSVICFTSKLKKNIYETNLITRGFDQFGLSECLLKINHDGSKTLLGNSVLCNEGHLISNANISLIL